MKYQTTTVRGAWCEVGPFTHRRLVSGDTSGISDLKWASRGDLNVINLVAVCPFGGPIARAERERNPTNRVNVHTSDGEDITTFDVPSVNTTIDTHIVFMNWCAQVDELMVVLNNGEVHFFTSKGDVSCAPICLNDEIVVCSGMPSGIALVSCQTIHMIHRDDCSYSDRKVDFHDEAFGLLCCAAVPESTSSSGYNEVFVCTDVEAGAANHQVLVRATFGRQASIDVVDISSFMPNVERIHRLAVASTISRIAMVVDDGSSSFKLFAGDLDFEYCHQVCDMLTDTPPAQLFWMGENTLSYLFLHSQYDEEVDFDSTMYCYPYPGDDRSDVPPQSNSLILNGEDCVLDVPKDAFVSQEVDGIRIISSDTFVLIQSVTPEILSVFRGQGSTASLLVQSYDMYAQEQKGSVENIRHLMETPSMELCEAVDSVVEAAGFEMDPDAQKRLLRVASFGRSFCQSYLCDNFVNMSRRLRVINNLRLAGIVITIQELLAIEQHWLIPRLTALRQYSLAFQITQLLHLPATQLVDDWAKTLIRESTQSNRDIADRILEQFRRCETRISLDEVATFAWESDKEDLALLLIKDEPCAKNQIRLLLQMERYTEALQWAVESGDPDLIFSTMRVLLDEHQERAINEINIHDSAARMLSNYMDASEIADPDGSYLRQQYLQQHPQSQVYMALVRYLEKVSSSREAAKASNIGLSGSSVELSQQEKIHDIMFAEKVAKATLESSTGTASSSHGTTGISLDRLPQIGNFGINSGNAQANVPKMLDAQRRLIDTQTNLMRSTNSSKFIDASISDTIALCFQYNKNSEGESLAKQFQVSEKMLMWCKLRGLIAGENWSGVDSLGSSKKSVIGFEPFVFQLLAVNRAAHAAKFVPKCAPIERRMDLYMLCDDFAGACEDSIRNKEFELLNEVQSRAKTMQQKAQCDAAIKRMEGKGGDSKGFSLFQ